LGVNAFCFLNNDLVAIGAQDVQGTKFFEILKMETDKQIFQTTILGGLPELNIKYGNLIVGFGYLYAFDLKKILSSVKDNNPSQNLILSYANGILSIDNLLLESPKPTITISDINGKVVKQLNLPLINGTIRIPLKLNSGTYLIDIVDGKKQYSSKFIVTK
jgi:hypothetical protein